MSTASFSRGLLEQAEPYIQAQVQKPFLQGLLNGDLPLACFEFWLQVDYPYLHNFVKVMALAVARADDPQDARVFMEHIAGVQKEMLDHEGHAARIGLPREALLSRRPSPLKYTYMTHQLATAATGTAGEAQAAVLACQYGYGECCRRLMKMKPVTEANPYYKWFAFHSADEHLDGLHSALDLLDRHAARDGEHQRRKMTEAFMISVQLETMLWDEYYHRSEWETH